MSKVLQQGMSSTATLNLTDKDGVFHPLPAGVVPAWTTDSDVVSLTAAADGMTCTVVAGNADGSANITATTTYEDGDVVVAIGAVQVVDAEDTQGTITFS